MNAEIYIEGGANGSGPGSKAMDSRCREGFRKLLNKALPSSPKAQLVACGPRHKAFVDFKRAHEGSKPNDYIALLVDSEGLIADIERPWAHLQKQDGWQMPAGETEDQVLLMTICMETWIAADPKSLKSTFGKGLQESKLLSSVDLERRRPDEVQKALSHATKACKSPYEKGARSFDVLAALDPKELETKLPSFVRVIRILKERL